MTLPVKRPPMVGPMRTLTDFPPVTGTIAGPDWVCGPVAMSGEADENDESNYDTLLDALDHADPLGHDWEAVRFAHFGVGWIEMVFARPGTKAVAAMGLVKDQLMTTGVLDPERAAGYKAESRGKDDSCLLAID